VQHFTESNDTNPLNTLIFAHLDDKANRMKYESTEIIVGMLTDAKAKELGVKAGDSIKLAFRNGNEPDKIVYRFHVRGIFNKIPGIATTFID